MNSSSEGDNLYLDMSSPLRNRLAKFQESVNCLLTNLQFSDNMLINCKSIVEGSKNAYEKFETIHTLYGMEY